MHKNTLWIGITGGIGSGKTTVCKLFETLNIPVYYADLRAKAIMIENEALISNIKTLLGDDAYFENGELNRAYIGGIVFKDKNKLAALNALVHPAVHLDGKNWFEMQQNKGIPYALNEAALMVESGGYKRMDYLITVFAPEDLRIERVMARDQTNREAVLDRISKQLPEEKKLEVADFIIYNDGKQALIPQVYKIHQQLRT